ncbi:hypothetical protein DL98DRAFT_510312 [Cadophora sp. DSE1049]|nr:hypothetical protein DL98DRAFT_510312 [Cadophora sp. DSE1049]
MRAEEFFRHKIVGCFGGLVVEAQATCMNTRDSCLGDPGDIRSYGTDCMGIADSEKWPLCAVLFGKFELEARKCDN